MIHPHTEIVAVNPRVGFGVRATRPIPPGTVVWALDRLDIVLSPERCAELPPLLLQALRRYGYRDHAGRWILCWDAGRLVNHSCRPVMRGVGSDLMIAVRSIDVGEELTCDYAECNVDPPMECLCGEAACRGRVCGADLLVHQRAWDEEVRAAVAEAPRVAQPLEPAMLDPTGFRQILEGRRSVPSLVEVYLPPERMERRDAKRPSSCRR